MSTKIHRTVDGLGYSFVLSLERGQSYDITQAEDRVTGFLFDRLIADHGYAAQDFVDWLVTQGIDAVIPPHQRAKQARAYDH